MATELGKAYVQIIPSAQGISGAIQKELGMEVPSAGQMIGKKFSTGFKIAALASITAVGAAIGKTISAAIPEGAALEQSLGGIETLFKGSADKVKKYANEAYKTAGLSANSYMENVTSFSASLLQSMGGNTEKAAETANMAMIDMSDNANKMGTNIQDIQNAYQGFAKQNYTMLDNLKLGYGGTQQEMKRLLEDATKLTGVKYDISSLSDVYDAIHAIQGELGITGTTAIEAAETFSGSFASMKAALSNFLGNLALGNDLAPSLNALAETTSTFLFNNFIPMVINIVKAIPGAVSTFLKTAGPQFAIEGKALMNELSAGLGDGLSSAIGTLAGIVGSIIGVIGEFIGWLTSGSTSAELFKAAIVGLVAGFAAFKMVSSITTAISSLKNVLALAKGAVVAFNAVLMANPIALVIAAVVALVAAIGYLWTTNEGFRNAVIGIWNSIVEVFSSAWQSIQSAWRSAGTWFSGVFTGIKEVAISAIEGIKSGWNSVTTFFGNLWQSISNTAAIGWQAFTSAVMAIVQPFVSMFMTIWNGVSSGLSQIWQGIQMVAQGAWELIKTVIMAPVLLLIDLITLNFTQLQADLSMIWDNVKQAVTTIWDGIKTYFSGVVSTIVGFVSAYFTNLMNTLSAIWTSVSATASSVWSAIVSTIQSLISSFVSVATSIWNGFSAFMSGLWSTISGIAIGGWNGIKSGITGIINGIVSAANSAWNAFKSGVSNLVSGVRNIFSTLASINLFSAGSAIMNGFLGGLRSVWGSIQSFVGGIAGWIRAHKGPIEYDRKLLIPAGKAIMGGLNVSLKDGFKETQHFVSGMAGLIDEEMTFSLKPINFNGFIPAQVNQENVAVSDQDREGVTINQTIHSPNPLTPSETARQTKKSIQELVLRW